MNAAGVLLAVIGAWIVTQVLAGDALARLGLVESDEPEEGG